jgi:hypothetical protein
MLDGATHNLLTNLSVHDTGQEGIHFRTHSSDNTLEWSTVHDTGKATDGFQVHVAVSGWGNDNLFHKNVVAVNGPGFGFNIDKNSSGNMISCDNMVTFAASGVANVACTP